jgi:hypothetical protein
MNVLFAFLALCAQLLVSFRTITYRSAPELFVFYKRTVTTLSCSAFSMQYPLIYGKLRQVKNRLRA